MGVLLVAYDLNAEVRRPAITKAIKDAANGWAKLSESSYAVNTNLSPAEFYARLEGMIDSNDQIYVITMKLPYTGFGPNDINEWLDDNLTF